MVACRGTLPLGKALIIFPERVRLATVDNKISVMLPWHLCFHTEARKTLRSYLHS